VYPGPDVKSKGVVYLVKQGSRGTILAKGTGVVDSEERVMARSYE